MLTLAEALEHVLAGGRATCEAMPWRKVEGWANV